MSHENKGYLSRAKERKSEKSPEYRGSINIEGTEYWLSAWVREKDGSRYFSLSVQPKVEQQPAPGPVPVPVPVPVPAQASKPVVDWEDGIPF